MRSRRRTRLAALAVTLGLAAGCGLSSSHEPTADRIGAADRLDDGFQATALADLLSPEEREAAARAGVPVDAAAAKAPRDEVPAGGAAAAASIGFLQVGLSLAAMAAPFFAF
jgi:hypothetical protein